MPLRTTSAALLVTSSQEKPPRIIPEQPALRARRIAFLAICLNTKLRTFQWNLPTTRSAWFGRECQFRN